MSNRVIKFRAWNKHNKAWETEPLGFTVSVVDGKFHIFGFDDAFADMYQVRIELQQYTGLTDKNGVEIYEGDILGHETRHKSKTGIKLLHTVKWNDKQSCFEMPWPLSSFEVIGNIYENPELLATPHVVEGGQ